MKREETDEEFEERINNLSNQIEKVRELLTAGKDIEDITQYGIKPGYIPIAAGKLLKQGAITPEIAQRIGLKIPAKRSEVVKEASSEIAQDAGTTQKSIKVAGEKAFYKARVDELEDQLNQLLMIASSSGQQQNPSSGGNGNNNPPTAFSPVNTAFATQFMQSMMQMQQQAEIMDMVRDMMPRRRGREGEDSSTFKKFERKFDKFEKVLSERDTEDKLKKYLEPVMGLKEDFKKLQELVYNPRVKVNEDFKNELKESIDPIISKIGSLERTSERNSFIDKLAEKIDSKLVPLEQRMNKMESGSGQTNPMEMLTHAATLQTQGFNLARDIMSASPAKGDDNAQVAMAKITAQTAIDLAKLQKGEKPSGSEVYLDLLKDLIEKPQIVGDVFAGLTNLSQKQVQSQSQQPQSQKVEFDPNSVAIINQLHEQGDDTFEGLQFDASGRPRHGGKLIPTDAALEIYNRGAQKYVEQQQAQEQPEPTVESKESKSGKQS